MCGIAGIVGRPTSDTTTDVASMLDAMPYRGPDDRGVWGEGVATLGLLRLAILDLSPAGHQPMVSGDGRFVISFNGEIYNYVELREELRRCGASFRSQTDTEVILEAFRQWGQACVQRFNGMWAFAIWDRQDRKLFLSRDRFGVKPLFYTWCDGVIAFASEVKALLRGGRGEPDWPYLYSFFDRCTPLGCDRTVFRDVLHLRPAHNLVWQGGRVVVERYWEPDPYQSRCSYDYRQPATTLRSLLTDAVRLRLRSDVPLGVCLSGGVDSSVVALLLTSLGARPVTFSSVYEEPEYSECEYIGAVNSTIGAQAHQLTPRSEDFFPVLTKIVHHHDEPVRMPGVYSHWHVMQCAAGHVTVLLDGQGADETLSGYQDYYPSYLASLICDIGCLRDPVGAWEDLRACLRGVSTHLHARRAYLQEAILRILPSACRRVIRRTREKERLFSPRFRQRYSLGVGGDAADERELLRRFSSILDREMYRTFVETNLPMLLRYEDRNSMAFSLEARLPFLDYRVVEFSHGLPYRQKMCGYTTKWILREAFRDLLPPAVYARRDKKGFPTPTAEWFRGPLRAEVHRRLTSGAFLDMGIVERDRVVRILADHGEGRANHDREIFRLLTLDIWLREYVSSPSPSPSPLQSSWVR